MAKENNSATRREFLRNLLPQKDRAAVLIENRYKVANSYIIFLGVHHTRETIREFGPIIADRVGQADFVLSEGLPFEIGSDIREFFYDSSALDFFKAVMGYAQAADCPVGTIDPQSEWLSLTLGAAEGLSLVGLIKAAESAITKTTRRSLLALAGLGAINLSLNYESLLGRVLRGMVRGEERVYQENISYGWDDRLGTNLLNYRNLRAGDRLRQLCERLAPSGGRRIVMVWGLAHQEPIIEYATHDHSQERAWKGPLYQAYDVPAEDEVRFYRFKTDQNKWAKLPVEAV